MYNIYSNYLKEKYGEKVYKITINMPFTCPNRDGNLGNSGCAFCAEEGAGHEACENTITIKDQYEILKEKISKKYGASKFILYFQNYSNTYTNIENFKKYLDEINFNDVVEVCISTRPDCISNEYLEVLDDFRQRKGIEVSIELGLQTVNYKTLKKINRGHSLAEFIDCIIMINSYKFETCAHVILNLPYDDMDDVIECAKILSALRVKQVKIHSLYIAKNTEFEKLYVDKKINIISKDEYIDRVVFFLRYLNKNIAIQRLVSRVPEENSVFSNWETSWWKIKEEIENKMAENNYMQGDLCNYLNGKALVKINEN